MRYFVTGTAGFVGFHLANRLLREGHEVVGYDNFSPYYDVTLKEKRNALLEQNSGFVVHRAALEDRTALEAALCQRPIDRVVHLAAQAGVRYSLDNPSAYIESNIVGTANLLELVRQHPVKHLMIASTSSAYGANTEMPFREDQRAAHPLSLYAATKGATELMAHSYSHLWGQPTTVFRFFTVYGPWGRPDMALFKFTKNILEGLPIDVYNNGNMWRDFTYVSDLVEGIVKLCDAAPRIPGADGVVTSAQSPVAPYRIVNIGGGSTVNLMDFIAEIEACVERKAIFNFMPMQKGDVQGTTASSDALMRLTGYRPSTPVREGVREFVKWYRAQYKC